MLIKTQSTESYIKQHKIKYKLQIYKIKGCQEVKLTYFLLFAFVSFLFNSSQISSLVLQYGGKKTILVNVMNLVIVSMKVILLLYQCYRMYIVHYMHARAYTLAYIPPLLAGAMLYCLVDEVMLCPSMCLYIRESSIYSSYNFQG